MWLHGQKALCSVSKLWLPGLQKGPLVNQSDDRFTPHPESPTTGGLVTNRDGWHLTHHSDSCNVSGGQHSTLQGNQGSQHSKVCVWWKLLGV